MTNWAKEIEIDNWSCHEVQQKWKERSLTFSEGDSNWQYLVKEFLISPRWPSHYQHQWERSNIRDTFQISLTNNNPILVQRKQSSKQT